MTRRQKLLKRAFDILGATAGLVALFPLMVVVAALIRLTSKGPALFMQTRVGRNGECFTCIKFRSMCVDAVNRSTITVDGDRRVTGVGRVLRRTKLDELPQLWNVMIGRMSFVGPRPDVAGYADKLQGDDREVLELRPGITGPATLFFRNEEELLAAASDPKRFNDEVVWPAKVRMNLDYLHNWSFWRDIGLILVTVIPSLDRWFRLVPEGAAK